MASTILQTLLSAKINLDNSRLNYLFLPIAKEQLILAINLLAKGYDANDEVEPLLVKYGELKNIPVNNHKS